MKEEELLVAKHVGEVMKIIFDATHNTYDPDELLKVEPLSVNGIRTPAQHYHRLLGLMIWDFVLFVWSS